MTYKEYYLKQHPESASKIDEIIRQRCPAEVVNCKYNITNQSDCFYQKALPTADVEVICEACWNQKMEESIKEEKEKKNMTYKELWIALHPGEEFIHDNEWEGECPDDFGYEPKDYRCPKDDNGAEICKSCWDREVPEETIKKFLGDTRKFKVGDRVKVVNPADGCFDAEDKIGIVTNEKSNNGLFGDESFPTINIKLEGTNSIWCVNEDGCKLISEAPAHDVPNFNDWSGKVVKLESRKVFLVIPIGFHIFTLLSPEGNIELVNGDLPVKNEDKITEVYKFAPIHATLSENLTDLRTNLLLWKAKEKKKMTYEDIVAALGYEFELV